MHHINSVYHFKDSILKLKAVSLAENFYTAFYFFVFYLEFKTYKGFTVLCPKQPLFLLEIQVFEIEVECY